MQNDAAQRQYEQCLHKAAEQAAVSESFYLVRYAFIVIHNGSLTSSHITAAVAAAAHKATAAG